VRAAGAEKVLFASDFGFTGWTIIEEGLDAVRTARLDDGSREKVLYANAARLLRLPERPL
jgi:predicted TIM-barrel fold metal-dependent hydrolase